MKPVPQKAGCPSVVKMIAVWGSNGSGKKTLSLSLAAHLARYKKNSVIISTDRSTPTLPVFLPTQQISSDLSLGELLNTKITGFHSLKGFIHMHPHSDRIGFMGIASGETPMTYREFKRESMISLLSVLNDSPFDYVIFSCQSNPVLDTMTQLAISTSEHLIRLITPDVRGIEFEKSQTGWMQGSKEMRISRHIRIYSPVTRLSPLEKVRETIGDSDYMLPFSEGIYNKANAGNQVIDCHDRFGIQYDKQVSHLTQHILSAKGAVTDV